MAAEFIYEILPGIITKEKLNSQLRMWQDNDRVRNGHQEGYSGDWQTVNEIKLHPGVVMGNNEASKIAQNLAEKWQFGYAVHYMDTEKGAMTYVGAWAAC